MKVSKEKAKCMVIAGEDENNIKWGRNPTGKRVQVNREFYYSSYEMYELHKGENDNTEGMF